MVVNMAVVNKDSAIHKLTCCDNEDNLYTPTDVNILGGSKILAASMKYFRDKHIPGRFVQISSVLSRSPIPGTGVYASSKAYLETLINTAALENASRGITCNSIRLGYFNGGLCDKVPEKVLEKVKEQIPVRRLGQIEDLHTTLKFLYDNSYVTGATIDVTGGL